jgi:hypothetical protein
MVVDSVISCLVRSGYEVERLLFTFIHEEQFSTTGTRGRILAATAATNCIALTMVREPPPACN